jgi:hypothetical protein
MNDKRNKAILIAQMQAQRAWFEQTLAGMSEAALVEVPVQEGWTAKDIVAHIAAWERQLTGWLQAAARGERLDVPAPGTWGPYLEQFNARCYAENCDRPLADVMAESREAFDDLMVELEALPEDPHHACWSEWPGGRPPWGLLAEFHEHYREHGQPIRHWLARQEGGS